MARHVAAIPSSTRWSPPASGCCSKEPSTTIIDDLPDRCGRAGAITSWQPPGEFGWVDVQRERLVLVVPPHHRLRDRKRLGLHELADEELVTTPAGYGFTSLVTELLAEAGVTPRISFESADLATTEGLVAAGSAWRSCPSSSRDCPAPSASH